MRVGLGYDVHKLVEDRKLIIGGVEIPYEKGLLGHSDADVLLHAIMDALLGAAALGDIGKHFPDTDDAYKGISSIKLLEEVGVLLDKNNYIIENIDATIIAQKPKMRPATDSVTITVIATGIEDVNVNTAMAKFSPKAQATQGVGQTVKPAVKPAYTYQAPQTPVQPAGGMTGTQSQTPLPGLKQPAPVTSNVKSNGITIPTFLQKNRK